MSCEDAELVLLHELQELANRELYRNVLPFWTKYSMDEEHGGFFSCLDEDGSIYDDRKLMWLNGRQIWMYATIYSTVSESDLKIWSNGLLSRSKLLEDARKAANFVLKHGRRDDGMWYFALSRDGEPHTFQRKMFAAAFICQGCAALHAAVDDEQEYGKYAVQLLQEIITLKNNPSRLGRPLCPGQPPLCPINVPMILLNLIDEVRKAGLISALDIKYTREEEWCVDEIVRHVNPERQLVFENCGPDGQFLEDTFDGRHLNPGHAIEAGWFLLNYARRTDNKTLYSLAENMVRWSFDLGWDEAHGGGLLYFMDSHGKSPPYLEHDMKLWWPMTEAIVAFAMLYRDSGKGEDLQTLRRLFKYVSKHFSAWDDSKPLEAQEWYGYLDRNGRRTHRFKGGPYKGCFHVPRGLFYAQQLLREASGARPDI
jgi:N-acylglucosamine 2-epimerase